jgi:general L-amino acid transport system permease protein
MTDVHDSYPGGDRRFVSTRAPTVTPVAFVAEGPIPPAPPPVSETGIVGWVRENLFSGWLNTLLTLASIAVIALVVPAIWTWAVSHAIWYAESLDECRARMDELYGEGVRGACWAIIRERFTQFMFGFYPSEIWWRPISAFVLLFVALGPVLFDAMPARRQMIWFTAAYPVIAYYLLWGGSIWPFVTFLLGVALGVAAFLGIRRSGHPVLGAPGFAIAGGAAVAAAYLNLLWTPATAAATAALGEVGPAPVQSDDFGGFMLTVIIGVTAISASLPLGVLLALGRQSGLIFIKMISVVFIEAIRGVPLITLLFVASTLLNYFLPPGTSFDIILRVVIMATFFAAAYIAEAVRGGLAALPKGQYEAADAMGLTYWQSMRLIILPQALKISIPSIVNIFIGLFKDTTLVSIIGLLDPLGIIQPILGDSRWQGIYAELYVFVAFFFFLCCYGMSRYSMYLERKLKTDRA